jgi:hypothetical protein
MILGKDDKIVVVFQDNFSHGEFLCTDIIAADIVPGEVAVHDDCNSIVNSYVKSNYGDYSWALKDLKQLSYIRSFVLIG